MPPIALKRSSAIRSIGRDFRRSLGFYVDSSPDSVPFVPPDRWDLFVSSLNKHNNLPSGRGDIKVFDGTARTVAMQDPGRPAIPTNIHWIMIFVQESGDQEPSMRSPHPAKLEGFTSWCSEIRNQVAGEDRKLAARFISTNGATPQTQSWWLVMQ